LLTIKPIGKIIAIALLVFGVGYQFYLYPSVSTAQRQITNLINSKQQNLVAYANDTGFLQTALLTKSFKGFNADGAIIVKKEIHGYSQPVVWKSDLWTPAQHVINYKDTQCIYTNDSLQFISLVVKNFSYQGAAYTALLYEVVYNSYANPHNNLLPSRWLHYIHRYQHVTPANAFSAIPVNGSVVLQLKSNEIEDQYWNNPLVILSVFSGLLIFIFFLGNSKHILVTYYLLLLASFCFLVASFAQPIPFEKHLILKSFAFYYLAVVVFNALIANKKNLLITTLVQSLIFICFGFFVVAINGFSINLLNLLTFSFSEAFCFVLLASGIVWLLYSLSGISYKHKKNLLLLAAVLFAVFILIHNPLFKYIVLTLAIILLFLSFSQINNRMLGLQYGRLFKHITIAGTTALWLFGLSIFAPKQNNVASFIKADEPNAKQTLLTSYYNLKAGFSQVNQIKNWYIKCTQNQINNKLKTKAYIISLSDSSIFYFYNEKRNDTKEKASANLLPNVNNNLLFDTVFIQDVGNCLFVINESKELIAAGGLSSMLQGNTNNSVYSYAMPIGRKLLLLLSYFSLSFLILLVIELFQYFYKGNRNIFYFLRNMWLRHKIFFAIAGSSFLLFSLLAILLINYFVKEHDAQNKSNLRRYASILTNEIETSLADNYDDEVATFIDLGVNTSLQRLMQNISQLQGVEINVYNTNGLLQLSTIPAVGVNIYKQALMNYNAYKYLKQNASGEFFQNEQMGNLPYVSKYVSLLDKAGQPFAYLNIPYYSSEQNFKAELSQFLATIINLLAFLLIVSFIIGYFLSVQVTRPLQQISSRLSNIELSHTNEPIQYKGNDELKILVDKYNEMVKQIEQSALSLAKNEREQAWRLMARQVAHEIKNPLTPMKLRIQLLERGLQKNPEELQVQVAATNKLLIEQIEHLSKIADDFADFAHITQADKELVNLSLVVQQACELFASSGKVHTNIEGEVFAQANNTQFNRVCINLIKNAIESYSGETVEKLVQVNFKKNRGKAVLQVEDFGSGISEDSKKNLFVPNFTTKTSGTGLGLAMCKSIIDHHKGIIEVVNKNNGTIFVVELPLA
jgi:signal transduction histidine kinase